jgi:uncharacterized protein YPO0396
MKMRKISENDLLNKFINGLIEDMTELKRQNYYNNKEIERNLKKIKEYEEVLETLKVPFIEDDCNDC